MYGEGKQKLNINWKSLLIKLGILLLIVFIICFVIFRPNKNKDNSTLDNNIAAVKNAAINYFKNNMSLEKIGDYKKITLEELESQEFISEQKDNNGNTCNGDKSYAYLTKVRDDQFVLKINMRCGQDEKSKVFDITTEDLTVKDNNKNEIEEPNDDAAVDNTKEETLENTETEFKDENNTNDKVIETDKKENPKKENKPIADVSKNNVLVYKHIKYGEWTEGVRYSNSIENSTIKVKYYEYCLDDYCVIDRLDNLDKYLGYTATYKYTKDIDVYRYVYVVWSNSTCIKGFTNTGITEYR
ncbi:MAG: hypothetical protein IJN03_01000 [Bacilli bacterium]|nr:hypothetical protein [Bacilli bacterium]